MTEYQDSHFYKELKESDLYILTEFFKVLGNPARIRGAVVKVDVNNLPEPAIHGIISYDE